MLSFSAVFPLLAAVVGILSWIDPTPLRDWSNELPFILAIALFCIALVIPVADWRRLVHKPEAIAFGLILQFTLMPASAWVLTQLISGDQAVTNGILLTSICTGTVFAIAMTFISQGDTCLAVALNILSAIWSVLLLPWLGGFLSTGDMALELNTGDGISYIALYMLLPVAAAYMLNRFLPSFRQMLSSYLEDAIALAIVFAIGILVADARDLIEGISWSLVIALAALALIPMVVGYLLTIQQGHSPAAARAIALELASQNTQQSTLLAIGFLAPAAVVVPALFSLVQTLICTAYASLWQLLIRYRIKQARKTGGNRVKIHDQDA